MNSAICLSGLSRGSTVCANGAYDEEFKYLRSYIDHYNADVFIHSWDTDISEKLDCIFQPCLSKYEQQKSFQKEMDFYKNCKFGKTISTLSQGDLFKTHSFLFSRYESIRLKREHEFCQNKKYDLVITCRFDVGHHNGGKNKTSYLPSNPPVKNLDKIHQAYWDQTNAGASDHWFITNSDLSDYIGELYANLKFYLLPNSEYEHCRRKHTDEETLLVNNHALYKWHFNRINKWNTEHCIFHNQHMWR